VERSPALVARQRATLGPLAARVTWTRADLARGLPRDVPFATCGVIFGNEGLDCFAPERVVVDAADGPRATFVRARLAGPGLSRAGLARAMADARTRRRVRVGAGLRPLAPGPGPPGVPRRPHPAFFRGGLSPGAPS